MECEAVRGTALSASDAVMMTIGRTNAASVRPAAKTVLPLVTPEWGFTWMA